MNDASRPPVTPLRATIIGGLLTAIASVSMALYTPAMPALTIAFGTTMATVKTSLTAYFAGFGVGVWAVVLDVSQLGVFLAYVGTPTATVIGFYSWKAKAENVVKIKKANPEETEGMPVDLNNVQP